MSNHKKSKKSNFKKPESAEQKSKRQFQNLAKMTNSGHLEAKETDNKTTKDNNSNNSQKNSDKFSNSQSHKSNMKTSTENQILENLNAVQENEVKISTNSVKLDSKAEKISDIATKKPNPKSENSDNFTNSNIYPKVMITILLIACIAFSLFVNGYFLPEVVLQNTDSAVAEKTKKETDAKIAESRAKKAESLVVENKNIKFMDAKVAMNIQDFGILKINLNDKAAPKTVENFVRLTNRKYFDGTVFHRIVKSPTFNVIQGGDPTATGSGGETASGEPLVDEVWKIKPESDPKNPGQFLNTPEFREPSLYKDFNIKTGEVTYAKGQILMAKTQAPDSASSQFFITLTDTKLPAEYTIFGTIQSESFQILDKIFKEVEPVSKSPEGTPETYKDGKPNKDLKIATLINL